MGIVVALRGFEPRLADPDWTIPSIDRGGSERQDNLALGGDAILDSLSAE
jgi:hypothetical protein